MDKSKYMDDLREIKDMMSRSTRFISLSGLSGIFAGVVALIGMYVAFTNVYSNHDYSEYRKVVLSFQTNVRLIIIAVLTVSLAILGGWYFTSRKAKRYGQSMWDQQARRMVANLMIPLVTGGLICLILLVKGFLGLVAPLTLVFYGLALVNASKYTLNEIRSLGVIQILLGLSGVWFIGYGLVFWTIGFGAFHILYGIIMYFKYER